MRSSSRGIGRSRRREQVLAGEQRGAQIAFGRASGGIGLSVGNGRC